MRESQFKKTLIKKLRKENFTVFDLDILSQQIPGVPDIIILDNKKYLLLELKMGENDLTKAQKVFLKKNKYRLNMSYAIYWNSNSYKEIIDNIIEEFK